jgi:hypothetical protein
MLGTWCNGKFGINFNVPYSTNFTLSGNSTHFINSGHGQQDPWKLLQKGRYRLSPILEFLSGLFEIPALSDFVFMHFVKKELDDPFKFSKTCRDFGIYPLAGFSGVLGQPMNHLNPESCKRVDILPGRLNDYNCCMYSIWILLKLLDTYHSKKISVLTGDRPCRRWVLSWGLAWVTLELRFYLQLFQKTLANSFFFSITRTSQQFPPSPNIGALKVP